MKYVGETKRMLKFQLIEVISTIKMKHKQGENISTEFGGLEPTVLQKVVKKVMISIEKKRKRISLESLTHSTKA